MKNTKQNKKHQPLTATGLLYCPLWRRLLAILYDSFAAIALSFLLGAIWVSLNSGQAITSDSPVYPLFLLSLWMTVWLYLAISWRLMGQTLGMRAWKIYLITSDNSRISWLVSLFRYTAAWLSLLFFGMGFIISVIRQDRACLHDLISNTQLIIKPPGGADICQTRPKL